MANQENQTTKPNSYHREEESDASKLANKHMADPDHIITDEDMRNIKVGVTGKADEPTKRAVKEAEDRVADHKADSEEDIAPGSQKTTPWDVLDS